MFVQHNVIPSVHTPHAFRTAPSSLFLPRVKNGLLTGKYLLSSIMVFLSSALLSGLAALLGLSSTHEPNRRRREDRQCGAARLGPQLAAQAVPRPVMVTGR